MNTRRITGLIVTVMLITLCATAVRGGVASTRTDQTQRKNFAILFRATGGLVVGDAADYFDKYSEKTFYGFGCTLEYRATDLYYFGANVEVVWKDMSTYHVDAVRMIGYSGSWIVRFSHNRKRPPYFRTELGLTSGSWKGANAGNRLDLDTYTFGRVGFGLDAGSSGATNTRIEVYYKVIFSNGHFIRSVPVRIDGNAEGIGVELALAVGL